MTHTVDKDNVRLDVFIASEWGISRSNAKTVIERDGAFVNGVKRQKSGFELKIGDVVEFDVPAPETLEVKAENIPLDIVYEDEYMAVVNKPQGMVVHQASSYKKNDTLVNALLYNLDSLSGINGVIRPGIVHRLDKDTSGLLVVAKNDEAHKSLASQIEKKSARRIYYGLCDGNFKEDEGTVDKPIARSKKDRKIHSRAFRAGNGAHTSDKSARGKFASSHSWRRGVRRLNCTLQKRTTFARKRACFGASAYARDYALRVRIAKLFPSRLKETRKHKQKSINFH